MGRLVSHLEPPLGLPAYLPPIPTTQLHLTTNTLTLPKPHQVCGDFYAAATQEFRDLAARASSLNQQRTAAGYSNLRERTLGDQLLFERLAMLPGSLDWARWDAVLSNPAGFTMAELKVLAKNVCITVSNGRPWLFCEEGRQALHAGGGGARSTCRTTLLLLARACTAD